METNRRPRIKRVPHPRIVANERYLANPDIVNTGNPNVNPARETERMHGDRSLSTHVLPDRKPLRRF